MSPPKQKLKRSYQKDRRRIKLVTTTVGFIRVRKRRLKDKWRWRQNSKGNWRKVRDKNAPTESRSYDLVRAVRINGEPRHKFVLGFGSPVSKYVSVRRGITLFWARSFYRMTRHGFSKDQRFHVAEKLKRKGIPLPTVKECREERRRILSGGRQIQDGGLTMRRIMTK